MSRQRKVLMLIAAIALAAGGGVFLFFQSPPSKRTGQFIKMVSIPSGTFTMGSPPDEPGRRKRHHLMLANAVVEGTDEEAHVVTISRTFLLGATEVTQGQWTGVMGENPSYANTCGANCPVEQITWTAAIDFCNRLSEREGFKPCYTFEGQKVIWDLSCDGYRLPTEAEWEYAARAGLRTAFHTGQCLSASQANIDGSRPLPGCPAGQMKGHTMPMASYPPNAWGLYDMHGNVSEWTWDWKGTYPTAPTSDPIGPAEGVWRVFRGGSYLSYDRYCRAAARDGNDPEEYDDDLGFRVARSPTGFGVGSSQLRNDGALFALYRKSYAERTLHKNNESSLVPMRVWHVLMDSAEARRRYHGQVTTFDRIIHAYLHREQSRASSRFSPAANFPVWQNRASMLRFSIPGLEGGNGFSFLTIPPTSTVNFYLYIDSAFTPDKICIGAMDNHPSSLPFSLTEDVPKKALAPPAGGYLIWSTRELVPADLLTRYEIEDRPPANSAGFAPAASAR